MDFGLGLVLSFTDQATAGMQNAIASLNQLTATAQNSGQSINALADTLVLSSFSTVTGQLGDTFLNMGNSIVGSFKNILSTVSSVGSEFESFRITLSQLYGEKGAETQIQNLMNYAKKSSYTVADLKDMLVTLKSQGVEAFDSLTSTVSGTKQMTMDWIGDLMAFKPDVTAQRWKLALQNFLGSGETKMLRNVLDAGKIEQIIGHGVSDTVEGRMQDLTQIVEKLNLTGLQQSLSTSWTTIASNFEDAWTRIYLAVADAGVFNKLKEAMISIYSVFTEMDDDTLQSFASSIAGGLNLIATPVVAIAKLLGTLVQGLVNLASSHPEIMKLVVAFTAFAGAGLVVTGIVLKIMSAMSGVLLTMKLWQSMSPMFSALITGGFRKILGAITPVGLTLGALAIAWKYNFLGMRDHVTSLVSNLQTSFSTAKSAVSGSVENMKTIIAGLDKNTFFGNLTLGLIKVGVLFKALCELFSGEGGYTLSEETFLKCKELGILPLVEAILDLKYRFEKFVEGFKEGFKAVVDTVASFISGIKVDLKGTFLDTLLDKMTDFFQLLSSGDAQVWYDLGNYMGKFVAIALSVATGFKIMSTAISIATGIVKTFIGIVKGIIGVVKGIVSFFTSTFGGIVLVISGVVLAVTNFVDMFKNGFSTVKEILMLVGIALATVGAIILGAPALIATVVAGIVALVANLVILINNHWQQIRDFFISLWDGIVDVVKTVVDIIKDVWSSIVDVVTNIWETVKNVVKTAIMLVGSIIDAGIQILLLPWNFIWQNFGDVLTSAWEKFKSIVHTALTAIGNVISTIWNTITSVISTIFSTLHNIFSSAWNGFKSIVSSVMSAISSVVSSIWNTICSVISSVLGTIKSIVSSIWNSIKSVVTSVLGAIKSTVSSIWNSIKSTISSVINGIKSVVSTGFNAVKSTISSIGSGIKSAVSNVFNSVKTTISNVISNAKSVVSNGLSAIKGFFSNLSLKLPHIKLPHFKVSGSLSISPPSVPKLTIDWYEQGGVFNKPSVIGVGENGQEAVMPLEKNTGWIGILASKIATLITGGTASLSVPNSLINSLTNIGDSIGNSISSVVSTLTSNVATNSTPTTSTFIPSNSNMGRTDNSVTNSQEYITRSDNSKVVNQGDDNSSVVFSQGSIVIHTNGSEKDAEKLAEIIMEKIKRKKQIENMTNYRNYDDPEFILA